MEWIKVKTSHVLYDYEDFSDCEFRAWIKIMCLTATIEREPSDKELSRAIHHKTLKSLQGRLKDGSRNGQGTLKDIIRKVQEDVEYTKDLKVKNKSKIAEWRRKHKQCNHLPLPVTLPVTLPDNEDKIREDNIGEETLGNRFNEFWTLYPKPIGQSMAFITFRATVKTAKDFEDLKTALKNYRESREFKDGYIKNGSNWIEDWRGWINMENKNAKKIERGDV